MPIRHLRRRDLLTVAASTLAAPALAAGTSRTLRYRATLDLVTLDPLATISIPAFESAFLVYDTLFGIDSALSPRPQMVDRYETSDDGLTWRFALRDELWFHDGTPVRAQDAVASIARWANRDRAGLVLRSRLAEMRALDDHSFQIRLTRPFARLLTCLATPTLLVMPEHVATNTPPHTPVKNYIGSGPFLFQADEWVPGAHAAFARNPRYRPRQESPSLLAGGKMAYVDRIEWATIPDGATAVAALQNNEIDFAHAVDADLVPVLRRNGNIVVDRLNQFGFTIVVALNTFIPPLDNPALRRAMLLIVNQEDCTQAAVGDDPHLRRTGVGVFAPGTTLATDVGMEALNGRHDIAEIRRRIRESGYDGARIGLMVPTDWRQLSAAGEVIARAFKDAGLNIDYQAVDWGTVVSRRQQVKSGTWHAFLSTNPGQYSTPGTHYFLPGNYHQDPAMIALRDSWYDTSDLTSERQVADQIQRRFLENPPELPLGQYYAPSAYRTALTNFVPAPWALFWNVKKS